MEGGRADDILARTTAAALAVSSADCAVLFHDLVRRLAEILDVDAAVISVFKEGDPARMTTLAAWLDGKPLENFEYELAKTPCGAVVGQVSRFVGTGVHSEFAPGTALSAMGFDSYAAHSLMSSTGEQMGIVVALDRAALADQALTEALLKIFSARAAAEIERTRAEQSYREILDAAEDAIFVHDWDTGAIIDVSSKAADLFGYSRDDLKRLRVGDLSADVSPYTEADAMAHIERARQSDSPLRFDWRAKHRDGTLVWHEVTLKRAQVGGHRRVLAFVRDVTERKAAADALQMRERQYRAIFDGSVDAMVLWNDKIRFVDVNRTFTEMYGFTREEVIGTGFDNRLPAEEVARRTACIRAALDGREASLETESLRKDGTRMHVELRYVPIPHLGAPHALAIARDITQRKRAEAALRASEAQYRGIFETSADALLLWDANYRVVDVNRAYERFYAKRREAVVGKTMEEVLPPQIVHQRRELVRRALQGETSELQTTGVRRDGSTFDLELRFVPFEHGGKPHVLAIGRDITERKRAENALRASEAQYRAIFEAATDSLQLLDAQCRVVDVNPAYERMYGKRREEVVGKGLSDLVPAPFRKERLALVQHALEGDAAELQTTGFRGDGTPFELEVRVIPFRHRGELHVLGIARDITERKRTEEAMRASEEQYRAIFNASADALVLRDADFRIVDVNATYERLSGWTRDEVLGLDRVVANPEDVARTIQALHKDAVAGAPIELEVPLIRRDGARYELELRGVPIQHRGQPHVLYIGRDITERKRAEDALRASEARHRLLFETESDALVLVDLDTLRLVDVNPAAMQMYGHSRDELLQMTAPDLSAEADATRRAIQEGEGAISIPARLHRRRDGSVFPVEIRANRLLLDGRMTVVAAIRDISERREREEQLRRSEARLRATVETSLDCVIGMDREGRVIEFNAAAERCFGYSRNQVLGRVLAEMIIPERYRKPHAEGRARYERTGEARVLDQQVQATAQRADGTEFPVELTISEAESAEGRIFIAYLRDVTVARQAEKERQRLEGQLRQAQKMEAIGQLTGGVAHDFNNILASVMGYVVLAEERATDTGDAKSAEYLDQALASCRRARDLIKQMLTFSRGGRGEPRALSLAAVVRDGLPMLRSALPSTLEIEVAVDDSVAAVLMDEVQAHQVLLNLAINARDASPASGRIKIAVASVDVVDAACSSCRHVVHGRHIELSVADSGRGIEPDLLERIFDPFFTTKGPGKGSGMGLATVHGIVHEHRGHIIVDTQPGQGCVFRILLPQHAGTPDVGPNAPRRRLTRRLLIGRVLLVDDEPSVLDAVRETLTSWGLQVEACVSAESAERVFAKDPLGFDLLITDHAMPMVTGTELAERLRELHAELPWLLCSGLTDSVNMARAQALGVSAVLRKPVEQHELRAAVEAVLGS